ncbi:MAG TPA: PIN domain-containing protein [Acetobacteraceae bacterium]|nr:PIN domain-containing protein [Acetobacteraceae bacterium]
MRLALAGLFQPQWSAHVHEEWIRAVPRDNPHIPAARLQALGEAIDRRIDDAVVTGYEPLIETLTLPDADDRHLLAAAITSSATIIVTRNLRDFPAAVPGPHGIAA